MCNVISSTNDNVLRVDCYLDHCVVCQMRTLFTEERRVEHKIEYVFGGERWTIEWRRSPQGNVKQTGQYSPRALCARSHSNQRIPAAFQRSPERGKGTRKFNLVKTVLVWKTGR